MRTTLLNIYLNSGSPPLIEVLFIISVQVKYIQTCSFIGFHLTCPAQLSAEFPLVLFTVLKSAHSVCQTG